MPLMVADLQRSGVLDEPANGSKHVGAANEHLDVIDFPPGRRPAFAPTPKSFWPEGRRPFKLSLLASLLVLLTTAPVSGQPVDPQLRIAGALSDGLSLRAPTAQLRRSFEIESVEAVAVDRLLVSVAPLLDRDGVAHAVEWTLDGRPGRNAVSVAADGSVMLEIAATLPATGVYRSEITLSYARRRESTQVTVTRQSDDLPLEVLELVPSRATATFWGKSTGRIELTLRETRGQTLAMDRPVLTSLSVEGPGKTRYQASSQLEVQGAEENGEIDLRPHQSRHLALLLGQLDGAGRYQGQVRFGASGYKPIDRPFTLDLKESKWIALSFILVGVVLSCLMRRYAARWRPRLVLQRRAFLLGHELDTASSTAEDRDEATEEILILLRRRLHVVQVELEAKRADNADATLDLLERKLGLFLAWRSVKRRVDTLRPESLRGEFRGLLESAESTLRRSDATVEEIKSSLDALQKAPAEISTRLRSELKAQIETLLHDLDALRSDPRVRLSPAGFQSVERQLSAAESCLQQDDLTEALSCLVEARRLYTDLLLDDLAHYLETTGIPPGLAENQWEALSNRVRDQMESSRQSLIDDPERAFDLYRAAYTLLLRGITEALMRQLESEKDRLAHDSEITDQQRQAARERLADLRAKLDRGKAQILTGELAEGRAAYDEVRRDLTGLQRDLKPSLRGAKALDAVLTTPLAGGALPFLADHRPASALGPPLPTMAAVERTLRWSDFLVTVAIFLIAGLIGLHALWTNDPSWGGWNARFVAILWGLGLHQVTFDGVSSLTDQLLGKKS